MTNRSNKKTAALSPTMDPAAQQPLPEEEKLIFEQRMGEMAYQVFSAQHPDLVEAIVTFKVIDSDLDEGRGVGAFILQYTNDLLYVPVVLSDNQLKPLDLVYVKESDRFVPLSREWLDAIDSTSLDPMGEGGDIPDTMATDVDIRNVVVPPTTGRYSYASARAKTAADASYPLGLRLHKLAMGMQGAQPQQGAAPAGGEEMNPEVWATFNEQFMRIHGMSPGQALDQGAMPLDEMAKMYKSHVKTWQMPEQAQQALPPANPQAMQATPQPQMPPAMGGAGGAGGAGAMPKMGSAGNVDDLIRELARRGVKVKPNRGAGEGMKQLIQDSMHGAGLGAATGGIAAAKEDSLVDVPNAMLRGAVGGGALGGLGGMVGRNVGYSYADKIDPDLAHMIGKGVGGVGGGLAMQEASPTVISDALRPSPAVIQEFYRNNPDEVRYASDQSINDGVKSMVRHAVKKAEAKRGHLVDFLKKAPNNVKTAFKLVLKENTGLLQKAAAACGEDELIEALRLHREKTAEEPVTFSDGLKVVDSNASASDMKASFGEDAGPVFRGVAIRGYYYKDNRKGLNLAVQVQPYQSAEDVRSAGCYRMYLDNGTQKAAVVVPNPLDLCCKDRYVFPKDVKAVVNVKTRKRDGYEPTHAEHKGSPGETVAESHKVKRLVMCKDGKWAMVSEGFGEKCSEGALKGSSLYTKIFTDAKAAPAKGTGAFVYRTGSGVKATVPVKITSLTKGSDGTISGTLEPTRYSWANVEPKLTFMIDTRSPINRPMRPEGSNRVTIPASWKWVPLGEEMSCGAFVSNVEDLSKRVHNALGSMGAREGVAVDAGASMYSVDGERSTNKVAALKSLATTYNIHAADAESILKIASSEGKCRFYAVPVEGAIKIANAMAQQSPQAAMAQGAPPAMQQAMPPAPPQEDPVSMAFSQVADQLGGQMEQLQAALGVLQMVQQRAMEIAQGGGGDPAMQMQAADPAAMQAGGGAPPMGPAADPAMDPAMQQQAAPAPAMMNSEGPSAQEIASQVNPQFLEQAASLAETGAFDTAAVNQLTKDPSLKQVASQYAATFEDTLDDMGRTLLTLYIQEGSLKEELGDEAYADLEEQVRSTFKGLGEMLLSMSGHVNTMAQTESSKRLEA